MADKFLNFSTDNSAVEVALGFQSRTTILTKALSAKMLVLMTELQKKAQSKVTSSRVRASIKDPRVEINSGVITGKLDWAEVPVQYLGGREYDLALILERGAKAHPVNPLTDKFTGKGTRLHEKGAKTRFGTKAKVLQFFGGTGRDGKGEGTQGTFRPYTFRKAMLGQYFMATSIEDMRGEFALGMRDALQSFKETPTSRRFNF